VDGYGKAVDLNEIVSAKPATVTLAARPGVDISPKMQVIATSSTNGSRLVEMSSEGELSLRLKVPGLRVVPEVFYHRLWHRPEIEKPVTNKSKAAGTRARVSAVRAAATPANSTITVTSAQSGKPVSDAMVVAFTDFAKRVGAQGKTGANGKVVLARISPSQALERIYVYPPSGFWDLLIQGTTAAQSSSLKLRAADPSDVTLLLRQLYGKLPGTAGQGVTIAIVDTGIDGKHPDLKNVTGGQNCVGSEVRANPAAKNDWRPAKVEGEHGTHVAGIAAAQGKASGFRGVSPAAKLRAYRVFPDAGGGASNFDIANAIDLAVADKCDVINLSLGGGDKDPAVADAIDRALAAGVVVVAAAGNDSRQPVSYPAALPECVCVSAMGRRGTFPKDSVGVGDIDKPSGGPSGNDFVADFSNIGSEVDVTGPGVEIVSTLPGGGYGPMSGTSMASPAVTGIVAYLLSANAAIRQAKGAERSRKLKDLLYKSCKLENFGRKFEGFGLPSP
jgi:subtilisin